MSANLGHASANKNGPIAGAKFKEAKVEGVSGKAMQDAIPQAGTAI